jgi:hypothetical protein
MCGRWQWRAQGERRQRAPRRALRKRSATADIANGDSVNRRWPTETLAYGPVGPAPHRVAGTNSQGQRRMNDASYDQLTRWRTAPAEGRVRSWPQRGHLFLRHAPWQHRLSRCRRCSWHAGTAAYIRSAASRQPGTRSALPQLAAAAVTAAVPYPALARLCQR